MTDQVEEVKQKTDIVTVIGERVNLKKAGSNYKGLCPFHSEKTPSFMVSPELQIYKCFGCAKSGDVYSFLEDYEGMDFSEALKSLAAKAGVALKPLSGVKTGERERIIEINGYISNFYHYVLTQHKAGKEALSYLTKDRGLTMSSVKEFKLGFSPNRDLALRQYIVERKKVTLRELENAGIVYSRDGRSFDRFRGRVIFPLFDHRGNTVGFAGRVLPTQSNKDLAKYINTPETLIYHKSRVLYGLNGTRSEIKRMGEVVIVEGELDLISSWQVGVKNIVAIKGSALTEEQTKLLSRFCKRIVLMLDTDFAGNEAARRGIVIAEREGFEVTVARLKGFKDPDEAARSDPDLLKKSIKDAQGVWDFIIDSVIAKYKGITGEEKFKISKELTPILATIDNKIVQAHYIAKLANLLHVPVEAVTQEVVSAGAKKDNKSLDVEIAKKPDEKTRAELLEERLLMIIFRLNPAILRKRGFAKLFSSSFAKRIVELFSEKYKLKKINLSRFAKMLPPEMREGFFELVLKDTKNSEEISEDGLKKEAELIEREIGVLNMKRELENLSLDINNLEREGKKREIKVKAKAFSELTGKLFELEGSNFKGIILKDRE